jgi:type I restriction enzyme, R subunit
LKKHGYPPDKQEKATQTILEQAEEIAKDWKNLTKLSIVS